MIAIYRQKPTKVSLRWGIVLLFILAVGFYTIIPVSADMISPAITHVYFEKDGVPYNGSVAYSVNCYGYYGWPASAIPNQSSPRGLVYHYSATCKEYGCSVYPTYYLQYTHIDWCDLEGKTDDGNFILRNFSSTPYGEEAVDIPGIRPFLHQNAGSVSSDDEEYRYYYYITPEYSACKDQDSSIKNPGRNKSAESRIFVSCNRGTDKHCFSIFEGYGDISGGIPQYSRFVNSTRDMMDETGFNRYLDSCNPVSDKECGGWILDGKPMKTYANLFPFRQNITHLKEHPCDRFLAGINASLVIPVGDRPGDRDHCYERCSVADQIFNVYFTIPESNSRAPSALAETVGGPLTPKPWTGESYSLASTTAASQEVTSSPLPVTVRPAGTFVPPSNRSPVEFLYCSIVELFGGTCA